MNQFGEAWLLDRSGNCIEVYAHPSESFEFESIVDIVSKYSTGPDQFYCNDWKATKSEVSKKAILNIYNQNWCRVRLWKDNKLTFRIASTDFNWDEAIADFLRSHPYLNTAKIIKPEKNSYAEYCNIRDTIKNVIEEIENSAAK